MKQENWKEFEELIAQLHEQLTPNAKVRHNQRVIGLSGRRRQLDVAIEQQIGLYPARIVLECKRHRRPVGIEKVEAFATKLEDVRASYGVMVSNTRFDEGARAVAKRKNIALLSYREATEVDWHEVTKSETWIKLIVKRLGEFTISVEHVGSEQTPVTLETQLFTEEGQIFITIMELIQQLAEEIRGKMPPGEFELHAILHEPLCFKEYDNLVRINSVIIRGEIEWWEYPINLKLAHGHILSDAQKDAAIFQQVITESWDMEELLRSKPSRKITREELITNQEQSRIVHMNIPLSNFKRFVRLVISKKCNEV